MQFSFHLNAWIRNSIFYYLFAFVIQIIAHKNCSKEIQISRDTPIGGVHSKKIRKQSVDNGLILKHFFFSVMPILKLII